MTAPDSVSYPDVYWEFLDQASESLEFDNRTREVAERLGPIMWGFWGSSVFSGDDLVSMTARDSLGKHVPDDMISLFAGELEADGKQYLDFRSGTLANRVNTLHQGNEQDKRQLRQLSTAAAKFVFSLFESGNLSDIDEVYSPQSQLAPDSLGGMHVIFEAVPDFDYVVEGPVQSVVSLGPGLSGTNFAAPLTGTAKDVHLVSGGMNAGFIESWTNLGLEAFKENLSLLASNGLLGSELPPGLHAKDFKVPDIHHYAGGMSVSIHEIPLMDAVFMSAVHGAGPKACISTIETASNKLREGGLLVVKAPDLSLGDEAGMDRIKSSIVRHLGKPVAQGDCGNISQLVDPTRPVNRSASFAIFQK